MSDYKSQRKDEPKIDLSLPPRAIKLCAEHQLHPQKGQKILLQSAVTTQNQSQHQRARTTEEGTAGVALEGEGTVGQNNPLAMHRPQPPRTSINQISRPSPTKIDTRIRAPSSQAGRLVEGQVYKTLARAQARQGDI